MGACGKRSHKPDIYVDDSAKAHIGFFNDVTNTVQYATNASDTFAVSDVSASMDEDSSKVSIVYDTDGFIHMAYIDLTTEALYYAIYIGGSWDIDMVRSTAARHLIGIARDGNPGRSYWD